MTQRVRPASMLDATSELPVKRHQVSRSVPTLTSLLVIARRSPCRLRRSAAIKSASKPTANVLRPASISMFAFIRNEGVIITLSAWPPDKLRPSRRLCIEGVHDDDERYPSTRRYIASGRPAACANRPGAGAANDWRDVRVGLLREPGKRFVHTRWL